MGLILYTLLLFVTTAHAHSCLPCDKARCVPPHNCPGGLAYDVCKCCEVCARQRNETCGGFYGTHGQCDVGLKCVIQPQHGDFLDGQETGMCKPANEVSSTETCKEVEFKGCNEGKDGCQCETRRACSNPFRFPNKVRCMIYLLELEKSKKDCTNLKCSVRYSPNCPADSELIDSVWPAGECCPLPSTCECRKDKCKQTLCRRGHDRVLVRKATGKPGRCCDQYQCKPRENICSVVRCAMVNNNITCPDDSVKITHKMSKDGCCELPPKCYCKSSICPETKCLDGFRPIVAVHGNGQPGTCCDVIQCVRAAPRGSCFVNGSLYKHGETFRPEPCRTCECTDGINHCTKEQCTNLECVKQYIAEGDCCPKCKITLREPPITIKPVRICTDNLGNAHLSGEVWFQDPCTRCVCKENGPKCTASSCQKNCENPRPVEGECCGTCDEPTYMTIPSSTSCPSMSECDLSGVECPFGFKSDDLGCKLCKCRQKSEVCASMTSCKLECSKGFLVNGVGCEICQCRRSKTCRNMTSCSKECPFGYRKDRSGCPRCKCRRCADVITSCDKKCKYGRVSNEYGCEICKCQASLEINSSPIRSQICKDKGQRRDDGEGWTSASGRQCVCRQGVILCDMIECAVPHCDHPVVEEGFACAVCPDSVSYKGDQMRCGSHVEGESWKSDKCTSCVCNAGRVMCTYEQCPPAPCARPTYAEGHCCPACPVKHDATSQIGPACVSDDGVRHEHGSIWRSDKCTSCECDSGVARCFGDKCPQVHNCLNPVVKRDQCCPQCLDDEEMNVCNVGDRKYVHGEVWSMLSDPCASCSCVHGNIFCRKQICRPLPTDCTRVARNSGECCDICVSFTIKNDLLLEENRTNLPLILGVVGGSVIVLLLVGAVVAYVIIKRKSKAKLPYHKGQCIVRTPGVLT